MHFTKVISKEKEDLIQKLLNEGHTYREITKIVRCSSNEITRTRRKITRENTEDSVDIKISQCALKHLTYYKKEFIENGSVEDYLIANLNSLCIFLKMQNILN